MSASGLPPVRSDNVSRRWRDGMAITPSGMVYADTTANDIAIVDAEGPAETAGRIPFCSQRQIKGSKGLPLPT
ncbi:MAG: class II aldolase/adducin family protein, partial [Hyphomicrobiaceae bacterium]